MSSEAGSEGLLTRFRLKDEQQNPWPLTKLKTGDSWYLIGSDERYVDHFFSNLALIQSAFIYEFHLFFAKSSGTGLNNTEHKSKKAACSNGFPASRYNGESLKYLIPKRPYLIKYVFCSNYPWIDSLEVFHVKRLFQDRGRNTVIIDFILSKIIRKTDPKLLNRAKYCNAYLSQND